MTTLEYIGAFLGIPTALIGLAGGWVSLVIQYKKYQDSKRPHGKRAVTSLVLARDDFAEFTEAEFIFLGDVLKWLLPLNAANGKLTHFEKVGEYYRVKMRFPPGQDLRYVLKKTE